MSLFKDDPPTPPSPTALAGAQTASNVSTAIANAFLNNTNQTTPLGNLSYDQTGTYSFTDPTTGSQYDIPRFTASQTLGPTQQATQDASESTKLNLAQTANTQADYLRRFLPQGVDYSQVSQFGDPSLLGNVPDAATTFDGTSSDRDRVEAALSSRLEPRLQQDQDRLRQQLADQGIRYGSTAYDNAFRTFNDETAAQRVAVTQAGLAEQQAAFSRAATRGQFQNAGLAQQIAQRSALINAQTGKRGAQLAEAFAARDQPINEISSLLSGSQVSQPSFMSTHMGTIPTTDIAGLTNQNFAQNLDIFKTQSANQQALLGGILGLGGKLGAAAITSSDKRVKENIHRMGTVFAATPHKGAEPDAKELPIYEYSYKADPASVRHVGPMAQDVEKIDPGAVTERGGVKHIYPARVMGSILRAA